jgi:hypothetical protein
MSVGENLPVTQGMTKDPMSDFREQCEGNLRRSVADRMRYGFNYVYKPVLDDAAWRSFDSMAEYRQWCSANLPTYLGYGDSSVLSPKQSDEA